MDTRKMTRWHGGSAGSMVPTMEMEPLTELHHEIERLFEEIDRWAGMPSIRQHVMRSRLFTPVIDVQETDDEVRIMAELPGLERKDIEMSLEGNYLMLRGEKRDVKETGTGTYFARERYFGSFERMIPLPCEVMPDKVDATFKDGVLCVRMPKTEAAKRLHKKIDIKGE